MAQLKLNTNQETLDAIRKLASALDMSNSGYMAPFLHAIATKQMVIGVHVPPPPQAERL